MSKSRHIYLKMKTLKEARKILFEQFPLSRILSSETISVPDAVGRVLAEPVAAVLSSPNYYSSAMDGIAVKATNTFGASETKPKELVIGISEWMTMPVIVCRAGFSVRPVSWT